MACAAAPPPSAAERDCDGRPRDSLAKLTCCVRSGSPSLSHLLQRGQGTRNAGRRGGGGRPPLRATARADGSQTGGNLEKSEDVGGELGPLGANLHQQPGREDREEESTGPRYDRRHADSSSTPDGVCVRAPAVSSPLLERQEPGASLARYVARLESDSSDNFPSSLRKRRSRCRPA